MDKKIIICIIAAILIICGIGYYVLSSNNNVGSSHVDIPEGFVVVKEYKDGFSMSDNKTNFTIKEDKSSLDKAVNNVFSKYKENDTVINDTMTVGDVSVKTMTLKNDENKTVHKYYIYSKNDKTFKLFEKGSENPTAVNDIISSTN